jgi:hypothetical protein
MTINLWPFIPKAVTNIDAEPFTVPKNLRADYLRYATDVNLFTSATEGRDLTDNHEAACRGYARTHGLHITRRADPAAPGLTRDAELSPQEIAERVERETGVSPRGIWAHAAALELATSAVRSATNTATANDIDVARGTCPICFSVDTAHPPRIRRHPIHGTETGTHWRLSSAYMCDDCHATALATLTTKAATTKTPAGKTRQAAVDAFLAS